jgi:hypothetical protein
VFGLEFRVHGSEFGVWVFGFGVKSLGFEDSGFEVWGLGFGD